MKIILPIVALANSTEPPIALENEIKTNPVFVFGNEAQIGTDGWALVAPLGEFPKDQEVIENGQKVVKRYLQIVDAEVVSEILTNEQGVIRRNLRSTVGLPVYLGHPDLAMHNQGGSEGFIKKLANIARELWNLRKASAVGTISDFKKSAAGGLETRITLLPEGAEAVANGHDKISILWYVRQTGEVRDGRIVVRPFLAASIGLTPFPNISGVDSLANAKSNTPAASKETKTEDTIMKQLLIGWLAAQGLALANDSTEQAVFDAFSAEWNKRNVSLTALGNDKTKLTGDLKTERAGRAQAVVDLAFAQGKIKDDERASRVVTLANSTDFDKDAKALLGEKVIVALENSATEFRKQSVEATVDLVITQGRLALAERDTKVTTLLALANDKLAEEIKTLKAAPVKFPVGQSALSGDRKAAADSTRTAQDQVLSLANSDERYKGKPFTPELFATILKENPSLQEQLNAAPATTTK